VLQLGVLHFILQRGDMQHLGFFGVLWGRTEILLGDPNQFCNYFRGIII
jgi:hypothetical protein